MLLCLLYLEFDFTQTSAHHSMNLWILNAVLFWVSFSVYWRPLVSKTPACSKQQWANELNAAFTGPLERLEVSFSLWVVLACVLRSSLRAVLSLHLALWFWGGCLFLPGLLGVRESGARGAWVLHYLKILLDFIQLSLNNDFDNDSVGLLSECNSNRIMFQQLSFSCPHVGQIFKIFVVFVCGFGRMRTGGGLWSEPVQV